MSLPVRRFWTFSTIPFLLFWVHSHKIYCFFSAIFILQKASAIYNKIPMKLLESCCIKKFYNAAAPISMNIHMFHALRRKTAQFWTQYPGRRDWNFGVLLLMAPSVGGGAFTVRPVGPLTHSSRSGREIRGFPAPCQLTHYACKYHQESSLPPRIPSILFL